ncbi:hypothetical protein O9992_19175 [Vibrio lentus]|nr:hypothetical protein [Vibrio lentus]
MHGFTLLPIYASALMGALNLVLLNRHETSQRTIYMNEAGSNFYLRLRSPQNTASIAINEFIAAGH